MAIRFTPEYNKHINDIVERYNKKVRRSHAEGNIKKKDLPEVVSVKTLKKSYVRRSDLNRELDTLAAFSRKSVRKQVTEHVSNYDLESININKEAAIKFYEEQRRIVKKRLKSKFPLQQARLSAIEENLKLLKKDTSKLGDKELWAVKGAVEDFRQSFERQASGYRGFLSEVELVMRELGISKSDRDEFFNKFSKLNPEEMFELYENNNLINRIYMLADSPKYTGGKIEINTTEEDARDLINELMQQADELIASVKKK